MLGITLNSYLYVTLLVNYSLEISCGCRKVHAWFKNALQNLHTKDEAVCIEDSPTGTGTMLVYLTALSKLCEHVKVTTESHTFGEKPLYQVEIFFNITAQNDTSASNYPVILIDAGQDGGFEPTQFALYIIEQLVTCEENKEMIQKVKWVILPCTNPDGMEYSRVDSIWRKNYRTLDDGMSIGVDISRNFEKHWGACPKVTSGFSHFYPGDKADSENETIFVTNILNKYKSQTKIYVSLKRDGHYIGFPYAYSSESRSVKGLSKVAEEVAAKVNQRAGGVQVFLNDTIYSLQAKAHCGNSVDLATDLGIPLTYEMRIFPTKDNTIMSSFHSLPRGYDVTLRSGYVNGIRELYNVITNKKKYPDIFT